jgi:hypothetical protein
VTAQRRVLTAQLEPAQTVISVGDSLSYSILNTGNVPVIYGADSAIEWLRDGQWIALPFGGWVTAIGKHIDPGQRGDTEVSDLTQHLAPGRYRLMKSLSSVDVLPSTDSIEIRGEFSIELFAGSSARGAAE